MNKFIIIPLLFASINVSIAQTVKLAAEQTTMVRNLVGNYYAFLQKHSEKPAFDIEIENLFSAKDSKVFDDIVENRMINIDTYLKHIGMHVGEITFAISEDIQKVSIEGIATEELVKTTKAAGAKVAITVLTKHTNTNGKETITPNIFVVDLQKSKIFKIENVNRDQFLANISTTIPPVAPVPQNGTVAAANTEITSSMLYDWYIQAILLYGAKKYEQALQLFERAAARGHLNSQYEAGIMYFLKKGCKHLSKKEREQRGYDWLIKAASQLPDGSRYNKARQTLDALGYY